MNTNAPETRLPELPDFFLFSNPEGTVILRDTSTRRDYPFLTKPAARAASTSGRLDLLQYSPSRLNTYGPMQDAEDVELS